MYEETPWIKTLLRYVRFLHESQARVKLIGICFGHQLIAQALGGHVCKNPRGWEVGATTVALTEEGKRFFENVTDLHHHLCVQQMHQVRFIP